MRPPVILSIELVAATGTGRLDVDDDVGELARATRLLDVAVDELLDRLRDGLAVGDLRLADGGVDVELAEHAVDDDLEVELAHAGDDRLAGLLVGAHLEGRVLLGQRVERLARSCPGRPWSSARPRRGSRARGTRAPRARSGCPGRTSVSPVRVFLRPMPATMSPACDEVEVLTVVGVHRAAGGRRAPCCSVRVLRTWSPLSSVPEYTRK